MPLVLDEGNRKRIANRLMLQPPRDAADVREFAKMSKEIERVSGFPADVLLTLENLVLLAEQGNSMAAFMYTMEAKRLGITNPRRF